MSATLTNALTSEHSSNRAQIAFTDFFQQAELSIFNYSSMDHNLQALYEIPQRTSYLLLREFCLKVNRPELIELCVVDYLDDHEVQAYAASDKGFHHIGVAYSLPILLQALFQQLLKNTNPFSSNEPEDVPAQFFPEALKRATNIQERHQDIEQLLINTMPETKWQKLMSTKLAELAVLFCFAHEISHIVWGHSALSCKRGLLGVAEFAGRKESETKSKKVSYRLHQAWELQADRTAMAFLFSYVNNNVAYKKRLLGALKCHSGDNPTEQLMARVTYAVSFVFFLFGQRQSSVNSRTTHPSSLTRQTYVMAHIVTLLLHTDPTSNEDRVTQVI